jgi:hypothetical protein
MDFLALSAILLAVIIAGAAGLHIFNLNRVHEKIESLVQCDETKTAQVTREALYKEMTISVGSNFCALALAAWILIFVAAAYLYFLVPTALPYSYMQIPELASGSLGFSILGVAVAIIVATVILFLDKLPENCRGLKPTELYSFYAISKKMKKFIGLTIPALCISVVFSAYVGTIYPAHNMQAEALALILLAISTAVLVSPIYKEAWEGRR